jgi:RimJ/RimL family protein N-acetyltransferase
MSAPAIETERLILRPWRDEDLEAWVTMNADPRVMEFFPSVYTRERALESAAFLREYMQNKRFGWWIAEIKRGAPFAGCIALQEVPFEAHFTPALEVGWRLCVDAWGHGYATEGARALLDYAFEELQRSEVVAMTAAINVRSRRVMERLNMSYDPSDDFEHPRLEAGHRLRPHVLYRIRKE